MLRALQRKFQAFVYATTLLFMTGIAFAQGALPQTSEVEELGKLLIDAFANKNWALMGAVGVCLIVWAIRTYGVKWFPKVFGFFAGDRGGAILVIVTSVAGAVITAILSGGAFTWGLLFKALLNVLLYSAGGFTLLKKILAPSDAPQVPEPKTQLDAAKVIAGK